jgi:hypothetical protein
VALKEELVENAAVVRKGERFVRESRYDDGRDLLEATSLVRGLEDAILGGQWSRGNSDDSQERNVVVVAKRCGHVFCPTLIGWGRFGATAAELLNFFAPVVSTIPASSHCSLQLYHSEYRHRHVSTRVPQSRTDRVCAQVRETSSSGLPIICPLPRPDEPLHSCCLVSDSTILFCSCWIVEGRG